MGDTNINTIRINNLSKDYINIVQSEEFNPLIFEATRVAESSKTVIDHIYINFTTPSTSGSLAVEIADHLPVFMILYDPELSPFPDNIQFRDFKRFKQERFKSDQEKENWSFVFNNNELNESYSRFLHTKKSLGADKVHPLLLSVAVFQIFRPLMHIIINLSISQGIFPDSMKISKVVHIFEQGSFRGW